MTLDTTTDLLTHLVCADATGEDCIQTGAKRGLYYEEVDAGSILKLEPMFPSRVYTFQRQASDVDDDSHDRLYAVDSDYLVTSVQDILGKRSEVAFMRDQSMQWTGIKRIYKAPKNVWVSSPGATLYEFHYRDVFPDGTSTYYKRIAGVSKTGKPVPCLIVGATGSASNTEAQQLVLAASIIEDAHRSGVFTASIKDSTEIVLPVPIGEHKDLFALREGPMTKAGRRKAILHWVAQHMRQGVESKHSVAAHLRGVRSFQIDGLSVTLSPNGVKQ